MPTTTEVESERYVANVDLTKVTIVREKGTRRGYNSEDVDQRNKRTQSVRVTVRADSLSGIKKKVEGVLALLDDDDLENEE